jgi:hypothetical protein
VTRKGNDVAKKALLIGINRYKVPGADLRGCINDIESVGEALVEYWGFPKSRIKKLKDLRATTARMRTDITKLLEGSKAGDTLVLHFSGHGSNVPDTNGDEADHRDEILCPTDLDWYDPLTDDWLRNVIDANLHAEANLTVIFDCCHSGSMTRRFEPPDAKRINRFLPCPLDLMAAESGRALRGNVRGRRGRRRRAHKDIQNVDIPEVLITGCRANQTSADAYIRGDYHGAMSYALVRALKKARGKINGRDLHQEMVAYLKKGRYDQVPQLEGRTANLKLNFIGRV